MFYLEEYDTQTVTNTELLLLTTSSNLNRYEKIFDGSAAVNV